MNSVGMKTEKLSKLFEINELSPTVMIGTQLASLSSLKGRNTTQKEQGSSAAAGELLVGRDLFDLAD